MDKRLRKKEVAQQMGWSITTLQDRLRDGNFIAPVYENKTPYWSQNAVQQFIEQFFSNHQ